MSPPLVLGSPAKSLGLRVCHSFCTCVRQSLSSLQRPEPEKRLFRQLPFSSVTSELPQQELLCPTHESIKEHLFFHLLHAVIVYSITLHFLNRISNPHLPLVSLHTIPFTSTVQPTASFFHPVQRQQKHPPNPCAYCRGRRLSSPCPFPAFPLAQLAVGSQRSSRSSFHLLHSFRKTYRCSPCCLAPRGSAQGCFTNDLIKLCHFDIKCIWEHHLI